MNSNNNPRVRVYDTGYGLKTAAKMVHDKVEAEESKSQKRALSKIEWENGRRRAIGQQRLKDYDRKAARLAELGTDAAQLESVLTAGVPDDRRESVESHLTRVRERMNKIEDDMGTLLAEIKELADGIVVEETVNA